MKPMVGNIWSPKALLKKSVSNSLCLPTIPLGTSGFTSTERQPVAKTVTNEEAATEAQKPSKTKQVAKLKISHVISGCSVETKWTFS